MLRSTLLTAILNCLTIFVISSPFFMVNASPTLKARSPELTVDISPSVIKTAIRQAAYQEQEAARSKHPMVSSRVARILVITLDTRNKEVCQSFSQSLKSLKSLNNTEPLSALCNLSITTTPIVRFFVMHPSSSEELLKNLDLASLNDKEKDSAIFGNGIFKQTGFMGLLWAIPESLRVWEQNSSSIFIDPLQEYTGQTLSGGVYSNLIKYKDSSTLTTLGGSAVVSTFFWDYGLADFTQMPSISDLVSTAELYPLVESYLRRTEESIMQNDTNSEFAKPSNFTIIGTHSDNSTSNDFLDTLVRTRENSQSKTSLFVRKYKPEPWSQNSVTTIGIEFEFKFHGR